MNNEKTVNGIEIFSVEGPNLLRERMVPLHTQGRKMMAARLGAEPGRASLSRWRIDGYPIDRDGPRVRLPYVCKLKKVYTSAESLARWLQLVQTLSDEVREAGGVKAWRGSRKKKR